MPTDTEADRLNIEYYRKAAKSLLKAARSGEPSAADRLARHSGSGAPPALHQAQLAIAREHGFPSWTRFRAFLAESSQDVEKLSAEFVAASLSELPRAEDMLVRHPEIAHAGLYTALVLGDAGRVGHALRERPSFASEKGGPRGWEPLLYVCFSRFAGPKSGRAANLTETARLLLSAGADPNAFWVNEKWPEHPQTAIYGATGVNNNPPLARLLLDAGARTDDGESLYHSTEHSDHACLRLLLEYGASSRATNVLKHMLDREDIEGLRLLLEAGADPNEVNQRGETALHWAVWRGRGTQIVAALLDAGAAVDARRNDGRTAYALAVRSGQTETATLLEARGANREIPAPDRFLREYAAASPSDYGRLLPEFASSHCTAAVRALLAAGIPVDTPGDNGGTALHWACWTGHADLVKILIESGASLTIEDTVFHATPAGWCEHGRDNSGVTDGDYTEVARLLREAGTQ